jgi:cytochrome c553
MRLALAALAFATSAFAQPAAIRAGDDLKVIYATSADITEGKRAAETACQGCHGLNGISATQEIPHLAGQRAPYLYQQLRLYKQGATRGGTPMTNAVKLLDDNVLLKTAAYYASLDPPAPAAAPAKATAARADPLEAAKAAAAGCAGCHGDSGVTKTAGTPSLAGLEPKYLAAAMAAYKSGQRKHDTMKSLVAGMSEADMANVALHFALQKPARAATPAPGDAAAGKAAAVACAGCHGEQGVSATAETPSLAGQDAEYLAAALRHYKDGSRSHEAMKGFAAGLDAATVKNLGAYYTSLAPQAPKVRRPMTAAQLAESRCDRCHGPNGSSTDPRAPALAAQRADYLQKSIQAYRDENRKSSAMHAMADGLTDADIESLAAFYSRQKPRSTVYIVLPNPGDRK